MIFVYSWKMKSSTHSHHFRSFDWSRDKCIQKICFHFLPIAWQIMNSIPLKIMLSRVLIIVTEFNSETRAAKWIILSKLTDESLFWTNTVAFSLTLSGFLSSQPLDSQAKYTSCLRKTQRNENVWFSHYLWLAAFMSLFCSPFFYSFFFSL